MNNREHQFYKINKQIKMAYHQAVRDGRADDDVRIYKEINENIVEYFAHGGLISHEWMEALGHSHGDGCTCGCEG